MKRTHILFFFIALVFLLSSCNTKNKQTVNTSSNNTVSSEISASSSEINSANSISIVSSTPNHSVFSNTSYQITKESYVEKDEKTNKDVKIFYPKIKAKNSGINEQAINLLLKKIVFEDGLLADTSFKNTTYEIDYNVNLSTDEILSVSYFGDFNVLNTAHPSSIFQSINIDIKSGRKLNIKDFIKIDDNFINKFKNGKFTIIGDKDAEWKSAIDESINRDLVSGIDFFNDMDGKYPDISSYLTKDSLGINIGISHAIGDNVQYEIKYSEIKDNITNDLVKKLAVS